MDRTGNEPRTSQRRTPGQNVGGAQRAVHTRADFQLSIPLEDLTLDPRLAPTVPISFNGVMVPSLGGIALIAKIGQGGMGAVYYGAHLRLMKEVAVKILTIPQADDNPVHAQRFCREAQLAAKIQSRHLIGVLDVNEENGLFYMVMEYIRGQNGHGLLRRFTETSGHLGLPEPIALDLCIAASEGLAQAHLEGVIHRDIKPANIMVPFHRDTQDSNYEGALLSDLGLARGESAGHGMTGSGAVMGTPGFMSPEQVEESKNCGKGSDVFSMGATLYAFLAGSSPFENTSMMRVLRATVETPHVPIQDLRGDVSLPTVELLERCLAKEPEKRFVDGSALLAGLKLCRQSLADAADDPAVTINAVMQLCALADAKEAGRALPPSAPTARSESNTRAAAGPAPVAATKQFLSKAASAPRESKGGKRLRAPTPASKRDVVRKWIAIGACVLVPVAGFVFWRISDESKKQRETQARRAEADEQKKLAAIALRVKCEALRKQLDSQESEYKNTGDFRRQRVARSTASYVDGSRRTDANAAFSQGELQLIERNFSDALAKLKQAEAAYEMLTQYRALAAEALAEADAFSARLAVARNELKPEHYKYFETDCAAALKAIESGGAAAAKTEFSRLGKELDDGVMESRQAAAQRAAQAAADRQKQDDARKRREEDDARRLERQKAEDLAKAERERQIREKEERDRAERERLEAKAEADRVAKAAAEKAREQKERAEAVAKATNSPEARQMTAEIQKLNAERSERETAYREAAGAMNEIKSKLALNQGVLSTINSIRAQEAQLRNDSSLSASARAAQAAEMERQISAMTQGMDDIPSTIERCKQDLVPASTLAGLKAAAVKSIVAEIEKREAARKDFCEKRTNEILGKVPARQSSQK